MSQRHLGGFEAMSPSGRRRIGPARPAHGPRMLLTALLMLAAVGLPSAPLAAQSVSELVVTPSQLELQEGTEQRLVVTAYDSSGNIVVSAPLTFATSDSGVVRVAADGRVSAVGEGVASILAESGGAQEQVAVRVRAAPAPSAPVSSLALDPPSLLLLPLETRRIVARALDATGSLVARPGVAWRSGDRSIAVVDQEGVVIGVAPGITSITATAGGIIASVGVAVDTARFAMPTRIVLTPGVMDTLYVLVPSQGERRLSAGLSWTTNDSTIVQTFPGGLIRAVRPGAASVSVQGYGMTGTVEVIVRPPVENLAITPAPADSAQIIPVSTSRAFSVRPEDGAGNLVDGVAVVWSVADSSIVEFAPAPGLLVGRKPGRTSLSATVSGFDPVVWQVEVVPLEVDLDRSEIGLSPGDRVQLAASLMDREGNRVEGSSHSLTWSSSRPAVASVANGIVSAQSLGAATITAATPWDTRDSVRVFVSGDLLVSSDRAVRGGIGLYQLSFASPATLTPVLTDTSTVLDAVFSPDRTQIAFSSNRAGNFDIWIMDADGTSLRRVTSAPGAERQPAWMPDGQSLVYTANASGASQLMRVGVDGTGATPLTAGEGGHRAPAISPDGRYLAYVSAREGNYDIWVQKMDGTDLRRITATPGREQSPHFFPDGDLLFASDRKGGGADIIRQRGTSRTVLATTTDPLLELGLSRDGRMMAWLTGRSEPGANGGVSYSLVGQRTETGAPLISVPLRDGEQIATPSF